MSNLDALTFTGEDHGVITNNISSADRAKSNRVAISGTSAALAPVNGCFLKVSAERCSNHFAQAECCARGSIDFVAVMRFDDLHIDAIAKRQRGSLGQLKGQIHTRRKIG